MRVSSRNIVSSISSLRSHFKMCQILERLTKGCIISHRAVDMSFRSLSVGREAGFYMYVQDDLPEAIF